MRRVVITGIGLVTPLGLDATSTWKGLLDGKGAVGPVRGFDASSLRTRLAAEIPGFDAKPFVSHVTLLRDAREPRAIPELAPIEWRLDAFALVQSVSLPKGSRYEVRRSWEASSRRPA